MRFYTPSHGHAHPLASTATLPRDRGHRGHRRGRLASTWCRSSATVTAFPPPLKYPFDIRKGRSEALGEKQRTRRRGCSSSRTTSSSGRCEAVWRLARRHTEQLSATWWTNGYHVVLYCMYEVHTTRCLGWVVAWRGPRFTMSTPPSPDRQPTPNDRAASGARARGSGMACLLRRDHRRATDSCPSNSVSTRDGGSRGRLAARVDHFAAASPVCRTSVDNAVVCSYLLVNYYVHPLVTPVLQFSAALGAEHLARAWSPTGPAWNVPKWKWK